MASEVTLGLKIDLHIAAQDIREPIFAYYHELERSRENQEALQHGQPLVTKTFRDSGRYWVILSFPDLPDIFCLDESHNKVRGITLEEVISRYRVQGEALLGFHGGTSTRSLPGGKAYGCLISRSLITGSKKS